jgi:ligand-binding sensor domain-containing protein
MSRWCRRAAAFTIVVLAAGSAHGQTGGPRLHDFRVDVWGAREGLATPSAWTIVPSPEGFLWIASEEGLQRFDGSRFKLEPAPGKDLPRERQAMWLAGGDSRALYVTRDGHLIERYDPTAQTLTAEPELTGLSIERRVLTVGSDGSVWIAGRGGIARRGPGGLTVWRSKAAFPGSGSHRRR